jgi:hypothetical protein
MMHRPASVTGAFALIVLGLTLAAVSVLLNIINAPEQYSRSFMIGYSVIRLSIALGLAHMIYRGKNWARIVYSVLAAASLVTGIAGPNPAGVHHSFVVINHWCGAVIAAVVLVLLFLPSSNPWFKTRAPGTQSSAPAS